MQGNVRGVPVNVHPHVDKVNDDDSPTHQYSMGCSMEVNGLQVYFTVYEKNSLTHADG